jgi:hypothetical protein
MDWIKGLFNSKKQEEVWEVNIDKLEIPVGNANNKGPQNLSWADYELRKKGGRRKTRKMRKLRKTRKAQSKSSKSK